MGGQDGPGRGEQMQRIVESLPHGLCLIDEGYRLLIANDLARERLALLAPAVRQGQAMETLGGIPLPQLLDGVSHEIVLEGRPPRQLTVVAHPVQSDEEARGWVLILRDVTERRRLAEAMREQERLAAVGQLAAGIAHDFNNILSSLLLYTQLLADEPQLSPAGRRRLQVMQEQTQRAGTLVSQVLDFSRRSVMQRDVVDVAALCRELVQHLQRTFPATIEVRMRQMGRRFEVWGDAERLRQILLNLATNAREAMPEGGVLSLSLREQHVAYGDTVPQLGMEAGSWLQLTVADSGSGIARDALPHIFEPFFSTKPAYEGAGLGLAQVYGIVKQHGGHVRVESEEQQGTLITVYLPLLDEPSVTSTVPLRKRGRRQILIVEENETLRRALSDTLRDALAADDYDLAVVESGREALDIVRQGSMQPDLVIGDLVLPQMSGIALLQALRRFNSDCRMIITSNYPRPADEDDWHAQGIVDWLQKPVSMGDLVRRIQNVLGA